MRLSNLKKYTTKRELMSLLTNLLLNPFNDSSYIMNCLSQIYHLDR